MFAKKLAFTRIKSHGVTPYETLRGHPVRENRAVPFGCQCLYVAPQTSEAAVRRLKIEPRGRTGVVAELRHAELPRA